jgi:hypothetical protein
VTTDTPRVPPASSTGADPLRDEIRRRAGQAIPPPAPYAGSEARDEIHLRPAQARRRVTAAGRPAIRRGGRPRTYTYTTPAEGHRLRQRAYRARRRAGGS